MMKRPSPRVLWVTGVLIVGLAAGVLLGRTAFAPDAVGTVASGSLCDHYATDELRALMPSTPYVTSSWTGTGSKVSGDLYNACSVDVKGGRILVTVTAFGGTADQWKTLTQRNDPLASKNGTPFKAGDDATAWQNLTSAYVSCPKAKTNLGMTVDTYGSASGSSPTHLKRLKALTTAFAQQDLPVPCKTY